jgi:trehalose 6-phosphate phosphatase
MAEPLTSIEPLLPIVRERPLGVFSDIDGTLAPIVPRPEDAAVPGATRALLETLIAKGVKVSLISGRSLEAARRMVGLEEAAYAAEHGLTLWLEGRRESAPGLAEYEALARQAEKELRGMAEATEGVELENKGPLLAVHYRRAADRVAAREAALAAIERSEAARRLRVQEGRMVIELRPRLVGVDKGTAAETLAERLGLRGLICLGDDVTDIDMFAAAGRLRGRGVAVASVAVGSEEAAPEVREAADYWLAGRERVEWLLGEIVSAVA